MREEEVKPIKYKTLRRSSESTSIQPFLRLFVEGVLKLEANGSYGRTSIAIRVGRISSLNSLVN